MAAFGMLERVIRACNDVTSAIQTLDTNFNVYYVVHVLQRCLLGGDTVIGSGSQRCRLCGCYSHIHYKSLGSNWKQC